MQVDEDNAMIESVSPFSI